MNIFWIVLDGMRNIIDNNQRSPVEILKNNKKDEKAVLFENVYTPGSSTVQTWLSILYCEPSFYLAEDYATAKISEDKKSLVSILKEKGYESSFFIGAEGVFSRIAIPPFNNIAEYKTLTIPDNKIVEQFCNYNSKSQNKRFSVCHLIEPDKYEEHLEMIHNSFMEKEKENSIIIISGDHGYDEVIIEDGILRHDLLLTQRNILTRMKILSPLLKNNSVFKTPITLLDSIQTIISQLNIESDFGFQYSQNLIPFKENNKERFFMTDNRFFKQPNRKTAVIHRDLKTIYNHKSETFSYYRLLENHLLEEEIEYEEIFKPLKSYLQEYIFKNKNKNKNVDSSSNENISINIHNSFDYAINNENETVYSRKNNILMLRTFPVEYFNILLFESNKFYDKENIFFFAQDFIENDIANYNDYEHSLALDDGLISNEQINKLKNIDFDTIIIPYNGEEFKKYIHHLKPLSKLKYKKVYILNILGNFTKINLKKTIAEIEDYNDNYQKYELLNKQYNTYGYY
jgi:hypothetical protein